MWQWCLYDRANDEPYTTDSFAIDGAITFTNPITYIVANQEETRHHSTDEVHVCRFLCSFCGSAPDI